MFPVILVVWLLAYPNMPAFIINTYETEGECTEAIEATKSNFPRLNLALECKVES